MNANAPQNPLCSECAELHRRLERAVQTNVELRDANTLLIRERDALKRAVTGKSAQPNQIQSLQTRIVALEGHLASVANEVAALAQKVYALETGQSQVVTGLDMPASLSILRGEEDG